MVNISLRVLSKPDASMLSHIFKSLGLDWDERVLPSIGNEILKAVVAQYNAEQLLTQRDKVSKAVSALCDVMYSQRVHLIALQALMLHPDCHTHRDLNG
jgi:hypothetical protein